MDAWLLSAVLILFEGNPFTLGFSFQRPSPHSALSISLCAAVAPLALPVTEPLSLGQRFSWASGKPVKMTVWLCECALWLKSSELVGIQLCRHWTRFPAFIPVTEENVDLEFTECVLASLTANVCECLHLPLDLCLFEPITAESGWRQGSTCTGQC